MEMHRRQKISALRYETFLSIVYVIPQKTHPFQCICGPENQTQMHTMHK